jgi:predicted TIM-barrel fold metal-dependent hydrolase
MVCPKCRAEYGEGSVECSDCHIPLADRLGEDDLGVVVQTGLQNPIGIGLAVSLLREAGIPFFAMDQNVAARQESGNFLGWWTVRVPREREAEAREILRNVEESK